MKTINLNILENHPLYVTQEEQYGVLEIFIAPFLNKKIYVTNNETNIYN